MSNCFLLYISLLARYFLSIFSLSVEVGVSNWLAFRNNSLLQIFYLLYHCLFILFIIEVLELMISFLLDLEGCTFWIFSI